MNQETNPQRDANTSHKAILILGANSAIAKASATLLAQQGYNLFLAGRNQDALNITAQDLQIRYPNNIIKQGFFDANQYQQHALFLQQVIQQMGTIQGVLLCFGYLGDQTLAATDIDETLRIINQNFSGAVSILNQISQYFIRHTQATVQQRFIIAISSVAGDRGRIQYTYGAAKSALNTYLQGLHRKMAAHQVRVVTIKPGFVNTPMTAGRVESSLMVSPEYVAQRIVTSIKQKRSVYYIPWFWRPICFALRLIPASLFKYINV